MENRPSSPTDAELKNLVERGFAYVAMPNILGGFALNEKNPFWSGGWNRVYKPTGLVDHTLRSIAGPNNDTLYVPALLDLRAEPVLVSYPAFDSLLVTLEVLALDHYIDMPLTTTKGDFKKSAVVLYYSDNTLGYSGAAVKGVDVIHKLSGDFGMAFLRVMPHAAEPQRFKKILGQINDVKIQTLSEFQGKPAKKGAPVDFPQFGKQRDLFVNHFLEIVQFSFNHTRFDKEDKLDQQLLAAFKRVGVVPGQKFDADKVATIAPEQISSIYDEIRDWSYAHRNDYMLEMFKPKGQITFEAMLAGVVTGPLGQPATEAVYPMIATHDGHTMNAKHDYVIRMTAAELPPAKAFWSLTLYDRAERFFIPNDRKKYSVGMSGGMKLDKDGGIVVYVAAEKPEGIPEENWLPIPRKDLDLSLSMRIYDPDLEKFKTWKAPAIERSDRISKS